MAKTKRVLAPGEVPKKRKTAAVRTDAQLAAGSVKDKVLLVIRKAFALGKANSFAGVKSLSAQKFPGGAFYAKFKSGGPYMNLAEDSAQFKGIVSAARSAKDDVIGGKYTGSVQKFLDEAFSIAGGTGGGGKRDASILKGVSF